MKKTVICLIVVFAFLFMSAFSLFGGKEKTAADLNQDAVYEYLLAHPAYYDYVARTYYDNNDEEAEFYIENWLNDNQSFLFDYIDNHRKIVHWVFSNFVDPT